MKSKLQKGLAVLLSVFMMASLAACGGTPKASSSSKASGESSGAISSSKGTSQGPAELLVTAQAWMYGKYNFDKIKKDFETKHPGVTVTYNKVDTADVTSNMLQWSQGKTNCDIAIGGSRETATQYVAKDYIINFDDSFFADPGYQKSDYFKTFLELGSINGKQYMIPITGEVDAVVVNRGLMKKAGLTDDKGNITPAKTWDELFEYAKKATVLDNGKVAQTGLSIDWGTNNGFQSYMASVQGLRGSLFESDGKTLDFTSKEVNYLLATWKKLVDNKYTPTDTFSDIDAGRTNFKAGKVAMLIAPASRWIECGDLLGASNVTVMPIPGTDKNGSFVFIQGAVIPKASKNQELAKQFIKEELLNKDFQTYTMNKFGKMSPLLAHYDNLVNSDWPTVIQMAKSAATAPLYKDYAKLDTNFLVELQKCILGKQSIEDTQANLKKIIGSLDLTTGIN